MLSPLRLAALKTAVSGACDEIFATSADSLSEDRAALWRYIMKAVQDDVSACIDRRNMARSPVYGLPSELLSIVLESVEFEDRLSVARVCKRWKDCSASCSVDVPTFDHITDADAAEFNAQLALLGPAPIRLPEELCLFPRQDVFFPTLSFIHEHMWHIETLVLDVEVDPMTNDQFDLTVRCLSTPAPKLRTFGISIASQAGNEHAGLERLSGSCDWFGSNVPKLRRCDFIGLTFFTSVFSSVRSASFRINRSSRHTHIRTILTEFPSLVDLCLDSFAPIGQSPTPFTVSSTLKCLWMDDHCADDLRNIDCTTISHIFMRSPSVLPRSVERIIPHPVVERIIPHPVVAVDIYVVTDAPYPVRLRASHAQRSSRIFAVALRSLLNQLPDALFGHASAISVHNIHLLQGGVLPNMPSLVVLTIYTPFSCPIPFDTFCSCDFKSLREVRLIFTDALGAVSRQCPAADIMLPLRPLLESAPGRVELLIRGTELVDPGIAELRSRASSLRIEPHVRTHDGEPLWSRAAYFDGVWDGNIGYPE